MLRLFLSKALNDRESGQLGSKGKNPDHLWFSLLVTDL